MKNTSTHISEHTTWTVVSTRVLSSGQQWPVDSPITSQFDNHQAMAALFCLKKQWQHLMSMLMCLNELAFLFVLIVPLFFFQVFLREAQRQKLQNQLHQEVLRRIVTLQRRFRAVLERRQFTSQRRAACILQVHNSLSGLVHANQKGILHFSIQICNSHFWLCYRAYT